MSDYAVVFRVGEALKQILLGEFRADSDLRNAVPGIDTDEAISFDKPTEQPGAGTASARLSLWLYLVAENEFMKNRPPERLPARTGGANGKTVLLRHTPLALNLYFLVTPIAGAGRRDQLLLGKAMQVFHDQAIAALREPEASVAEQLHITLCRLSLEELTRVWEALREPYRLSVCYQVTVTRIDSKQISSHARIFDRRFDFTELSAQAG